MKKIKEKILTVAVKICNNTVQSQHNIMRKNIKQWKLRSENVTLLYLKYVKGKYSICDKTDSLIEQMNIIYYTSFNLKEKWDHKVRFIWALYKSTLWDNKWLHSRIMKDWRKYKYQWEISLVENEYLYKKNYTLFHLSLTEINIWAVITLTKEDNQWEKNNVFKSEYTEESVRIQKKIKKIKIREITYWVLKSDNSDINKDNKEWQQLKRIMIINKAERMNLVIFIFSYTVNLDAIIMSSISNSLKNLKKHLNNTQVAADKFKLRVLQKIKYWHAFYLKLNKVLKTAEQNVRDINKISFKNWEKKVQNAFKMQYRN